MKNRDVLISGASIAGPALAYWLRRYGFRPTVVERAPRLREGGQAIDLRGAARDAAERMGIMPQVRQAHTGARGMAMVDRDNRRLASMGSDLLGDSGGLIADIEILRGDLAHILYEASQDGVEYIFGDSIASLALDDDGVTVTFEHAAPRRFDLVVGADGVHSMVRSLAFGNEARFVRPLGAQVAVFGATTSLKMDGWELMYRIPGKRGAPGKTAALYPLKQPGQARAMFYFVPPSVEYDRHNVEEQKRLVAEAFAGEGWQVPEMLRAMWEAQDFYFDSVNQVHMSHWSAGRVALLGDAGYCPSPMTGLGTSLALVGAYVLAGELAVSDGDYAVAYARYEREMRPYVEKAQAQTKGAFGFLMPKSHRQAWMLETMFRMLPYLPWRGLIAAGVAKAANAVTLKDYPHMLAKQAEAVTLR